MEGYQERCNLSQRTETDLDASFIKILACKERKLYSSIFSLQVILVHNLNVSNCCRCSLTRPFTCSCVCTCRDTCHGPCGGQTATFGSWFFSSSLFFLMKSPLLFLLPCSSASQLPLGLHMHSTISSFSCGLCKTSLWY